MQAERFREVRKPDLILFLSASLLLAACSATKPIGTPFPEGSSVEAATITIRKKSGEVYRTRSFLVRNDSLLFEAEAVDLIDVESITKTEPSPARTAGLVAGIGAGILVLVGSFVMLSGIGVFGGGD